MRSFSPKTPRKLIIAAAGLALFGGAAGAVAATHGSASPSHRSYMQDLAKRLGVAPDVLTSAMKAARVDRIEAELAAGRISKARADALKQRLQSGASRPAHRSAQGLRRVAAQYLGITPATLRGELRAGRSLAQVASSTPGKSVEGLRSALTAAAKARVAANVASGALAGQQEQKRLDSISRRIDALLNRTKVGAAAAKRSRSARHQAAA